MAEVAVGLAIGKLISLLSNEANLLRNVHKEVEEIKCELQNVMAFLKEADSKAEKEENNNTSHGVKVWVEELREVAFQILDVIDMHKHIIAPQQRLDKQNLISFPKLTCFILEQKSRHKIASKIQHLKQKVRDINQNSVTYGFNPTQQGSTSTGAQPTTWYDTPKYPLFLNETEVVGIESSIQKLIGMLEGESSQRSVLAVVGMGGLGKTTLVHQVYARVKKTFDCCAWIEVSQTYNKVELLRNLMKKFCQAKEKTIPDKIDRMDESTIVKKLRDYLQGKKYVVVFDDVWHREFWGDIKNAIPDDTKRSGIFITTRDISVANFCKSVSSCVYIHHLECLPPKKAWELFCNKVFHSEPNKVCPADLNDLSHEIVKRCEGLPLAIIVIAGLLSTKNKNDVDEWRKVCTNLSSELDSTAHLEGVNKILSLSYNDLDYYLKSCFLYFGIFPKGYFIRYKRLIRLWIAEGFVKSTTDKTLEVVAEEYLVELQHRSLIQVSYADFDGKARSFFIHDLLREIILKKMGDLSCCEVFSGNDSNFTGLTRRLSLPIGFRGADIVSHKNSHVKSIFIFEKDKTADSYIPARFFMNFKLLHVLQFDGASSLYYLPYEIGNLFYLRSLSLRNTKVGFLPDSIGKLENLEILDLKRSWVNELPVEIKKLRKLRYLVAYLVYEGETLDRYGDRRGFKIKKGIEKLEALQKLFYIEANLVKGDLFKELSKLTELRKLGITKLRTVDGGALCSCIEKMKHLESLEIYSTSEDDTINLEAMSSVVN